MKMKQEKTDYGDRHETGEKLPPHPGTNMSGGKKERLVAGVGMGMKDSIGKREKSHLGKHEGQTGEFNGGVMTEGASYQHIRIPHDQDSE